MVSFKTRFSRFAADLLASRRRLLLPSLFFTAVIYYEELFLKLYCFRSVSCLFCLRQPCWAFCAADWTTERGGSFCQCSPA